MKDLGIGRTPIREALVRLRGERMVESHPNHGMIVRPITIQDIKAMFEAMSIFECGAAEISVTKNCSGIIQEMRKDNALIKKAVQEGRSLGSGRKQSLFSSEFRQGNPK